MNERRKTSSLSADFGQNPIFQQMLWKTPFSGAVSFRDCLQDGFGFFIRKDRSTSAVCIWQSIRQGQRN
jgi:hypothetical protein